jgi:ATP-dependent DNA helicase PIF1
MLVSPIQRNDARGELINRAALITLDEASMLNRAAFKCADDVCRRVMNNDKPFGVKIVVLLRDFRQTCPVIPGGTRPQIVDACIQSSPLWQNFAIRRLSQLIRNAGDPLYANFVNGIRDGEGPEIDLMILSQTTDKEDLLDFVFPSQILRNPSSCLSRGIVAPTNKQVDKYNNILLGRIDGVCKLYYAADTIKEDSDTGVNMNNSLLDYVVRHTPHGLPPHSLYIKTNAIYRLLRNFSIDRHLVKNARVVVTEVGTRIITVRILREQALQDNLYEEDILIPRISFSHVLSSGHTLLRRQFPLALAYSTTFHSCEGMTYNKIGIDLTRPIFTHGQLYTALSWIRHRDDA